MGFDRRWFVLRWPHLVYFKTAAAAAVTGAKPRGAVTLTDCEVKQLAVRDGRGVCVYA